jgi:serine/threonine protein kinase
VRLRTGRAPGRRRLWRGVPRQQQRGRSGDQIILPQYANQPEFIRRFESEARLVARLEHPHIVPLYDYWREPNAAYLIMRLLRGGSLRELLKNGPLEPGVFLRMLEQVGAALHAAHRFGVIHRDLKPANILLDEEQNAYLADFGIAKNLGDPCLEDQTQTGMMIGSPAYISPEQIRAEPLRPQADIYCLGVLIFEMLSGRPLPGPTPFDCITSTSASRCLLRQYNPALPVEWTVCCSATPPRMYLPATPDAQPAGRCAPDDERGDRSGRTSASGEPADIENLQGLRLQRGGRRGAGRKRWCATCSDVGENGQAELEGRPGASESGASWRWSGPAAAANPR